MTKRDRDPFSNPPLDVDPSRVEDSVCRALLRWAKVPVGAVARAMSISPADRMTFDILHGTTRFPLVPAVTGCDPGSATDLITKFSQTKLFEAWRYAGLDEVKRPALVFRSSEWPMYVLHRPLRVADSPRPRVVVYHPDQSELWIEPAISWAEAMGWDGGDLCPESLVGG